MKRLSVALLLSVLGIVSAYSQAPTKLKVGRDVDTLSNVSSDTSGSGTAQSCSTTNVYTVATNTCFWYTTTTTNSGTGLTVNPNSLGAKPVAIPGSSGWTTTLTAGVIPTGKPIQLCYDGTNLNVQQTGTAAAGVGGSSPWKGGWSGTSAYSTGDIVSYNGVVYVATSAVTAPSGAALITSASGANGGGATLTRSVTAGHLLKIVFECRTDRGCQAPTDSLLNTWTLALGVLSPESYRLDTYITTASSTGSDTITFGGDSAVRSWIYEEWSNVGTTVGNTATSVSLNTGTYAPSKTISADSVMFYEGARSNPAQAATGGTTASIAPVFDVNADYTGAFYAIKSAGTYAQGFTYTVGGVGIATSFTLPVLGTNTTPDADAAHWQGAVTSNSVIDLRNYTARGTTNTFVTHWGTVLTNTGSDMTLTQSTANGDSITINTTGLYAIRFESDYNSGDTHTSVTLNASNLNVEVYSLTNAERLLPSYSSATGVVSPSAGVVKLTAGDVIRAQACHDPGSSAGWVSQFMVRRVQ